MDEQCREPLAALAKLCNTEELYEMRAAAKTCLLKSGTVDLDDIKEKVKDALEAHGFRTKIQNMGFICSRRLHVPYASLEACHIYRPEDFTDRGPQWGDQDNEMWKHVLLERLSRIREATGMAYIRSVRHPDEVDRLRLEAAGDVSTQRIGEMDSPFTNPRVSLVTSFLYSAEDFYHALNCLGQDRGSLPQSAVEEGFSAIQETYLNRPETVNDGKMKAELSVFLKELGVQERHLGVDDLVCPWFRDMHLKRSLGVSNLNSIAECWKLARHGLPNTLRPKLWKLALGLKPNPNWQDHEYFESLCKKVEEQEMLTDLLIEHDVRILSGNQHFFPFEEVLRSVLLAFSRDPAIGPNCSIPSENYVPTRAINGKGRYPPSGILPFKGLVLLAAPLCMVYDDPTDISMVFRVMYCRFWSRLVTFQVEDLPQPTSAGLCRIFESLLKEIDPEVYHHLNALGCPPLHMAFPWIFSAFVGYLCVEELLLLWDRLIGWDSLVLLPVLAAAVMTFRRKLLLEAKHGDDLDEIVDDLSHVKIMPLLQAVLTNS